MPEGGEDWPYSLSPQHTTEPSTRTPHVWLPPALTEVKAPDGGEDCPASFCPEHTTERSVVTPQL